MSWATWPRTRAQRRAVEADMVAVLGELGLSRLGGHPRP